MRRYSPEIEAEIANIRDEFNAKIIWLNYSREHLLKKPDLPQTNEDRAKRRELKKRLKKVEISLHRFNQIIDHLPDELDLVSVPLETIRGRERRKQKRDHKEKFRPAFFKHVANDSDGITQLKQMELTDQHIDQLRKGQKPKHTNGHEIDVTVDHIQELSLGGSTEFDNLCLVPRYINELKNFLFIAQAQCRDVQFDNILVVTFKKNTEGKVPLCPSFPDGFRQESNAILSRIGHYMGGINFK